MGNAWWWNCTTSNLGCKKSQEWTLSSLGLNCKLEYWAWNSFVFFMYQHLVMSSFFLLFTKFSSPLLDQKPPYVLKYSCITTYPSYPGSQGLPTFSCCSMHNMVCDFWPLSRSSPHMADDIVPTPTIRSGSQGLSILIDQIFLLQHAQYDMWPLTSAKVTSAHD